MFGRIHQFYTLNALLLLVVDSSETYSSSWSSLDSRPLPQWYDEAKFGIFIHWGVYSVPGFGSEWFWEKWKEGNPLVLQYMREFYDPHFSYANFAQQFKAEFFDPEAWAQIFENSGAKYVVITSKHHDGFTLWPSKYSFNWNSVDVGPRRDIIWDLEIAIRKKTKLRFGLYYSLFEFFHPLYLFDRSQNFSTQYFVSGKTIPELIDLVGRYKPDIIWSDGSWWAPSSYWKSAEFLSWLYNESPVKKNVVANDRWGRDISCKHGDFYTCEDNFNPGYLMPHKWENCMTLDKNSWGFRRDMKLKDVRSVVDVIKELVVTVSCGGNLLLNVGPTADGMIPPIMVERLQSVGKWLRVNGEAIYKTTPWKYQRDTTTQSVWYTNRCEDGTSTVYAFGFQWPCDNKLILGSPVLCNESVITLLGENYTLEWKNLENGIEVTFPALCSFGYLRESSELVWCLKLTNVIDSHKSASSENF